MTPDIWKGAEYPHEAVRQHLNYLRSRGFDRSHALDTRPVTYRIDCSLCKVEVDYGIHSHARFCPNEPREA